MRKLFLNLKITNTRFVILVYFSIIFIGTVLLSLPFSTVEGESTSVYDALFTSTSASCVTGLVLYDTATHWSYFGQIVILFLIQVGGLGFMSIITLSLMAFNRRVTLTERKLFMLSSGQTNMAGIPSLLKRLAFGTFIFEGIGAFLLSFVFCQDFGMAKGIYVSIFFSISAFCNAGFDLTGTLSQFSSLTHYSDSYFLIVVISCLIIIGGLGFIVWNDIINNGYHFEKYMLHTKLVLITSVFLLAAGTILFLIFEYDNSLKGMSIPEALLNSFFQSVTARTAGFNTVSLDNLSSSGSLTMIILMFIGGSPGSTAGGIKTTTFILLILAVISTARHTTQTHIFKKRLEDQAIKKAGSVFVIYLTLVLVAVMIICAVQPFSLTQALFEVVSAIGTVGLTTGITPFLSAIPKVIITCLMFTGKIGGLSLALFLAEQRKNVPLLRPTEKIIIG